MSATCTACTRPVSDATLCRHCTDTLAKALGDVTALMAEIPTTHARLSRTGGDNGGRRSAERPLPWDERASEAAAVLDSTLTAWVHALGPVDWPWTPQTKAVWLLAHLEQLRQHPDAADALDEISAAVREVTRVIDRPAERWFAGTCGADTDAGACREGLYVRPGATQLRCRGCGSQWDVAERREWLLAALDDTLATAGDILRGLPSIAGVDIRSGTLRQWRNREQLQAHGVDMMGRELYRVGDVLDLARRAAARNATRRVG